jgi:hypothetical protein
MIYIKLEKITRFLYVNLISPKTTKVTSIVRTILHLLLCLAK